MNNDGGNAGPDALWFPDTTPPAGLEERFTLPAGRLLFYRPLDSSGGEEDLGSGFVGFNPLHDPDCEALARVVAGVAAWGEEFVMGQLAAMNAPPRRGEEGLASLIGRLRESATDGDEDRRRTSLNRARLLLALDELRRRQEEEIAAELARAEAKEAELLGELACVSGRSAPVPRLSVSSGDRRRLVRAWFRLFARSLDTGPRFLVCGYDDADFLVEACECPAVASFSLPGPEAEDWPDDIVDEFAALAADPAGFPESRRDALFLEMAAAGGGGAAVSFHLLPWNGVMAALGLDESVDEKKGELGLIAALSLE